MPKGDGNRGKGKGLKWLIDRVSYQGDDCLIWPFATNHAGYGMLGYFGKIMKANRLMCILAHGQPPEPRLLATHNCGKGHLSCVNPRHLEWKTCQGNRIDANLHGTGNARAPRRLTIDQVEKIRASSKGYIDLAAEFGVAIPTIGKIKRYETWVIPRSKLTLETIRAIRDAPEPEAMRLGKALGFERAKIEKLRAGISFQGVE